MRLSAHPLNAKDPACPPVREPSAPAYASRYLPGHPRRIYLSNSSVEKLSIIQPCGPLLKGPNHPCLASERVRDHLRSRRMVLSFSHPHITKFRRSTAASPLSELPCHESLPPCPRPLNLKRTSATHRTRGLCHQIASASVQSLSAHQYRTHRKSHTNNYTKTP